MAGIEYGLGRFGDRRLEKEAMGSSGEKMDPSTLM
jgi:hypothetical protein